VLLALNETNHRVSGIFLTCPDVDVRGTRAQACSHFARRLFNSRELIQEQFTTLTILLRYGFRFLGMMIINYFLITPKFI